MEKTRDQAFQKYKKDKIAENWERYKNLRNYTLASIRREKTAYLKFNGQSDEHML